MGFTTQEDIQSLDRIAYTGYQAFHTIPVIGVLLGKRAYGPHNTVNPLPLELVPPLYRHLIRSYRSGLS